MQKITPFLLLDGKAEEAMNFYTSVFKNSKVVDVARSGDAGSVFSATIELDGERFHLLNTGPKADFTAAISFFVNCETQAEVDELWDKLLAGGAPLQLRLAEGQVRPALADHPVGAGTADARQGCGPVAARDAGDDEDDQDRHRRPRARRPERMRRQASRPVYSDRKTISEAESER